MDQNRILTRIIYTMKLILILSLIFLSMGQGITFAELQEKIISTVNSPFVHLMFVYDSATQMGPLMEKAILQFGQKKQGYLKIIPVDCNTDDKDVGKNFPYCSDKIRPKLPALMYTEPNLNPVSLQGGDAPEPRNHQYQGQLQEKPLYDYAIPLMKLYSVLLKKPSDWNRFKESYPNTPKVIYFTDKDKISPFFKALTANFRSTIAFAHVFKNSSLCQEFGVNTFPTLLLEGKERIELTSNIKEQIEILKPYEGEETTITIHEYQQLTTELSPSDIQEKILKNPAHILVHIPSADGTPHPEWKKCQQSFKRMFEYYEGEQVIKELGVKHRPSLVYYPKSLAKKELKKTIFYSNSNFRSIYDEISGLIEDFTVPLSSDMEMQQLTSIALNEGRFVAILFHREDISLSYRVLSNDERFKQPIVFFRMKDPEAEVMQNFNIKKLPTLLVMTADPENTTRPEQAEGDKRKGMNLQVAEFKAKFNYDDLEKFLNVFVQKPKEAEVETEVKALKEIKSKKQFESQCLEEGCYLLLIDGSEEKLGSNAQYLNTLKRSLAKINQNVAYLDAKCHSQFLAPLEIYAQDLPALIFLNHKFQKYARLVGRIEDSSIQSLLQRVKSNKALWRNYDRLSFENKDCIKQHKRLKELETSGFQMSAEQAEILEQIKQEQQEKKKEAAANDQSSKKKRRRRRPKEEEDSDL